MQARHFKIVLWISVLIIVWQLGRSDVVLNALFLFAAVGAVPGTHITLQPNEVFWALGGILTLGVLLIFATNLRRGIVALFRRSPAEEPAPAVAAVVPVAPLEQKRTRAAKAPKPKIVVVIKPVRRPGKLRVALRALAYACKRAAASSAALASKHYPRLAAALGRSWSDVRSGGRAAAFFAVRIASIVWRQAVRLAGIARERFAAYAHTGGRCLRHAIIRAAIQMGRASVRAWAWLEPRLQLFDYWLGVQYHTAVDALKRNDNTKVAAHVFKEANKVIAAGRAEVRDALTRALEK